MSDIQVGVNLVAAEVAVTQADAVVGVSLVEAVFEVGAGVEVAVSVDEAAVMVEMGGPPGPVGPPGGGPAVNPQIYVGPLTGAPAAPTLPVLMVLREAGAPAGQTALVVREP